MGTLRDPAAPRPRPRRAPRAPPPPARPRAAPRTLIRRHITCRSGSSPGDALPRRRPPVANSISIATVSRREREREGGTRLRRGARTTLSAPPFPASLPPPARPVAAGCPGQPRGGGGERDTGGTRPGATRRLASSRGALLGRAGTSRAVLSSPPHSRDGRGVRPGLERIRSRRAAGFRNSSGLSAGSGNVRASSSSPQARRLTRYRGCAGRSRLLPVCRSRLRMFCSSFPPKTLVFVRLVSLLGSVIHPADET